MVEPVSCCTIWKTFFHGKHQIQIERSKHIFLACRPNFVPFCFNFILKKQRFFHRIETPKVMFLAKVVKNFEYAYTKNAVALKSKF